MSENLPKEVSPFLNEIAEKLWSGHAALMVGSGFSKNADKTKAVEKKFPNWNELGNILYEKVNGFKPKGEEQYLNVLRIANELQASFGRSVLENIIKDAIPDKEYQPSALHYDLLKLPWTDIFTTNYDSLLERTAEKIVEYRYETITNKEDLVHSTKPRIIKLHGSFPSTRPLIISEDDYREYPRKFAPFVNTVQQSLLENTLCLIGFSADDPNFLKWIGWIRDNLGKENAPRIYLIGMLSLSRGKSRLLEERNIIPIDLGEIAGIGNNHKKALSFFLKFLRDQEKSKNHLNWPKGSKHFIFRRGSKKKSITDQIKGIINEWELKREEFPNWLIVPNETRESLWDYTNRSIPFLFESQDIESPWDLIFLYELNWRFEKCLVPIFNNLVEYYENILAKYNFFSEDFTLEIKEVNCYKALKRKWIELQISLLRYYREEGYREKWVNLKDKLKLNSGSFDLHCHNSLKYETCLYDLFSFSNTQLKNDLKNWKIDLSSSYWAVKKAGLLAEIGELNESEEILQDSLNLVRERIAFIQNTKDFSLISEEGYIMLLLRFIQRSLFFNSKSSEPYDVLEEENINRWNAIRQFKCDPWNEVRYFELKIKLNNTLQTELYNEEFLTFDLNSIRSTTRFGTNDRLITSYTFLRFIEELGFPIKLPRANFQKDVALGAIENLRNHSPLWSLVTYIRTGDTQNIDTLFSRKSLLNWNYKKSGELVSDLISAMNSNEKPSSDKPPLNNSLEVVTPVILSRLCIKCNFEIRLKILEFLKDIYLSENNFDYKGLRDLCKHLILTFTFKELDVVFPQLLEFPVDERDDSHSNYPDPILFLTPVNSKQVNQIVPEKLFDKFLVIAQESKIKRKRILARLLKLNILSFLNEEQNLKLSQFLWAKVDKSNRFPKGTDYYKFSFCNFPFPPNKCPDVILREYIEYKLLDEDPKKIQSRTVHSKLDLLREIKASFSSHVNGNWDENTTDKIAKQLIEWYKIEFENFSEQYYKYQENPLIQDHSKDWHYLLVEFHYTFCLLLPFCRISEKVKDSLISIYSENLNIPLFLVTTNITSIKASDIVTLKKALLSNNKTQMDASIYLILRILKDNNRSSRITEIAVIGTESLFINQIKLMNKSLNLVSSLVQNYSELLNPSMKLNIEISLSNLLKDTVPLQNDTDKLVNQKLLARKAAVRLAAHLVNYFKSKKVKLPKYLHNYEAEMESPDEFYDIKRVWTDIKK